MAQAGRRRRIAAWVLGILGVVLLVGAVSLMRSGYVMVTVASRSMEPTYAPGDVVILQRVDPGQVRRGDVVLIRVPERYPDGPVLQRVIGVGGDRVAQQLDRPVTVNGTPLDEPYAADGSRMARVFDVTVPAQRLFLLGDHRGDALDSRFFLSDQSGTVPVGAVLARDFADPTWFAVLILAALLGVLCVLTGAVLGVAAWVVRRRSAGSSQSGCWDTPGPASTG